MDTRIRRYLQTTRDGLLIQQINRITLSERYTQTFIPAGYFWNAGGLLKAYNIGSV
jgi:hypothetical protein